MPLLHCLLLPTLGNIQQENNNNIIPVFNQENISLVALTRSKCTPFLCFIRNGSWCHSFLKGNTFCRECFYDWMKDRGCFFLASPPCTGMSAWAYWTVAAAFWPTSWPSILQRLPFRALQVWLSFINVNTAVCAAHLIILWAECGCNGDLWIQNLVPTTFPQHYIFYLNVRRVDTTGA